MRKATALIVAVTFGVFTAAPAANAFNPQPEPPKSKEQVKKIQKVNPGSAGRSKANSTPPATKAPTPRQQQR